MMHENSLSVFYGTVKPDIKKKHEAILEALAKLGTATSLEVADYLNKPLNAISGRFTELSGRSDKEYGRPLIRQVGQRKNRYNNICAVWQIIPPIIQKDGEQISIF